MDFQKEKIADILIVKPLLNAINYGNYIDFKCKFLNLSETDSSNYVIIDLTEIKTFDSSAIGVMITIGLTLAKINKKFAICGLNKELKRAFELAHLGKLYPIFSTVEQALEGLKSGIGKKGEVICIGVPKELVELMKAKSPGNLIVTSLENIKEATLRFQAIAVFVEETYLNEALLKEIHDRFGAVEVIGLVRGDVHQKDGVSKVLPLELSGEQVYSLMVEIGKLVNVNGDHEGSFQKKLFKDYATSIPNKMDELRQINEKITATKSMDSLCELRNAVHKIAGSAGTYGYVKAGEISREFTHFLDKLINEKTNDFSLLDRWIREIEFAFNAVFTPYTHPFNPAISPVKPKNILNISTDENFKNTIQQAANKQGFIVSNLPESSNIINNMEEMGFRPEIVVIDHPLGENKEKVFHILQEIKQHFSSNQMHFWIALKDVQVDEHIEALKKGVELIISKPVPLDSIVGILDQYLSHPKSTPKVFILDDDKDVCDFCAGALLEIGVKVEILMDPSHIFEVLEEVQPDLFLLDINLPKYDGWTLLEVLRRDSRYKNLRVVIISGAKQLGQRKNLFYDDIWYKPFQKGDFQKNVLEILEKIPPKNDHISSFNSRKDFENLIDMMLHVKSNLTGQTFHVAIIKSLDFKAEYSKKLQRNFLIEAEQLMSLQFNENYLKANLDQGYFGLFAGWVDKQLIEEELKRFIKDSEYKIMIRGETEIYTTFSVLLVACEDRNIKASQLISYALENFEKSIVMPSEMQTISFKNSSDLDKTYIEKQ